MKDEKKRNNNYVFKFEILTLHGFFVFTKLVWISLEVILIPLSLLKLLVDRLKESRI